MNITTSNLMNSKYTFWTQVLSLKDSIFHGCSQGCVSKSSWWAHNLAIDTQLIFYMHLTSPHTKEQSLNHDIAPAILQMFISPTDITGIFSNFLQDSKVGKFCIILRY